MTTNKRGINLLIFGTAAVLLVLALPACAPSFAHRVADASRDAKVMVVSANLRESHPSWPDDITGAPYSDLDSMGELSNFVNHLGKTLPAPPDVLLLQEVIAPSAQETARLLAKKFGLPYRVVIVGGYTNQVGPKFDGFKHKQNTAILINTAQIEVVGKVGFMTLSARPGDWSLDAFGVAQEQAHALLEDRKSGEKLAVMSIHWPSTPKFVSMTQATLRRADFARRATKFMTEHFPAADIRVMGGEFNVNRCGIWRESLNCDEHPAYETITRQRHSFHDAVYTVSRHSLQAFNRQVYNRKGVRHRIDYIFTTGKVITASRSIGYDEQKFTPKFFSDHRYDYAWIGS